MHCAGGGGTLGVAVAVSAMKGTSGSASRSLYRWRYCTQRRREKGAQGRWMHVS